MLPQVEHELHRRRKGRNLGLLGVLLAFVVLVFGMTVVKISQGDMMQAYDHRPRASMLPRDPAPPAAPAAPVAVPGTPGAALPGAIPAPAGRAGDAAQQGGAQQGGAQQDGSGEDHGSGEGTP